MDKVKSHGSKQRRSGRGRISRMLRQQKARLYIIQRCVVMLLCYHD
ncbi:hypothetical protein CFC21_013511 [Triticum aestivum]|nr:uncharacterized protein LOC119330548 [Triticum dicoccoides]XP_040251416.1 small polypeptide DEVIL 4-like [Aegilops tauschii subsp. strangulata]XP_044446060.1 small polypeptide DEVIL 4-like [Triticum aestivum]XP_044448512.1 small polypeptide DEVIL 4-like [Triticum aestivum]XP_048557329.1 small polypeptide DEVIL 4-like [Triticum urartu]KAF6986006.1 hypothetical protein CFC21_003804 [Triticum aestivum]KAF6997270.1 hypothetical protein CFC21_013511 [Triticum aestivum]